MSLLLVAAGVVLVLLVVLHRTRSAAAELSVWQRPGKPGRYEAGFEAMGTDGRVEVVAADLAAARRMIQPAVSEVRRIERLMSAYRPDSEISRLNRLGARQEVGLSRHTLQVLHAAARMYRLTGGAFDVTYAPLRTVWREARDAGAVPAADAVARALASVGQPKVILAEAGARLTVAGMELDLGGIAKGYAIDVATQKLREAGARAGIVDIGGDLRLFGLPEADAKWAVEVRRPPGLSDGIVLRLSPCAVTTSGDYARGFWVAGQWFSHIIDPRTGRPVPNVASVTVIAPDATTADALATGLSVMGPQEGIALVDSLPGVECMMMVRQSDGTVRRAASAGFWRLAEEA